MHQAAGNQRFIAESLQHIKDQIKNPTDELRNAVALGGIRSG